MPYSCISWTEFQVKESLAWLKMWDVTNALPKLTVYHRKCASNAPKTASPWHYHCVFIRPQLHNAASCCKIFQITKQVIAQRPSFILLFLLCFSLPKYLHFLMRITLKPQLLQHKQKHRESQYVLGQTHTKKIVFMWGFFSLLKSRYSCIIHNKPPEKQTFYNTQTSDHYITTDTSKTSKMR